VAILVKTESPSVHLLYGESEAKVDPAQSRAMGGAMVGSDTRIEAAHAAVRALVAAKVRFLLPMTITYFVGYIGLTVVAGFAKDLMAVKVVGSLNVGFTLIALNYALSWSLALIYERVANRVFDPLSSAAAASAQGSAR
jgi:uncharacterized membrane protein (DUF485 family)